MAINEPTQFKDPKLVQKLIAAGWREYFGNDSQMFSIDNETNDMGKWFKREIWPNKENPENSVQLTLFSPQKSDQISVGLDINSPTGLDEVIGVLAKNDMKTDNQTLLVELLKIPNIKIVSNKYDKKTHATEISEENLASVLSLNSAKFEPIPKEKFNFYLGTLKISKIHIKKENFQALKERLVEIEDQDSDKEMDYSDMGIPELIQEFWTDTNEVEFDQKGDIVNITQGDCGDIWVFDQLEQIAQFIEDGSHVVLQDDCYILWRVEYNGGRAGYFREKLKS